MDFCVKFGLVLSFSTAAGSLSATDSENTGTESGSVNLVYVFFSGIALGKLRDTGSEKHGTRGEIDQNVSAVA